MRPGYFLFNYFYFLIKNINYGINLSIKYKTLRIKTSKQETWVSRCSIFLLLIKKKISIMKKKIVIYSSTAAKRNMKKTIKNLKFLPN